MFVLKFLGSILKFIINMIVLFVIVLGITMGVSYYNLENRTDAQKQECKMYLSLSDIGDAASAKLGMFISQEQKDEMWLKSKGNEWDHCTLAEMMDHDIANDEK